MAETGLKKVRDEIVLKLSSFTVKKAFFENDIIEEYIEHPNAVIILPLLQDNRVVLLRQFRPVVGEFLYELPAGKIEKGETPREAAFRELEEETGFRATTMELLGEHYPSPGVLTEKYYSFLATGLKPSVRKLDKDEVIEIKIVSLKDLIEIVYKGLIRDSKTLATIFLYLVRLNNVVNVSKLP